MPWNMPDDPERSYAEQAKVYESDLDALVAGIGGQGVSSGCTVAAQSVPNMTLAVAAGVIWVGGSAVTVSAGNVTVTTADATNPRLDLVVVNSSGTKSVVAGTPDSGPRPAEVPANSVVLARIQVPATVTAITSTMISDRIVEVGRHGTRLGTGSVYPRRKTRYAAGTNVAIAVTDDPTSDEVEVAISATSGTLEIQDESVALPTAPIALNFTGAGVTASGTGTTKTIDIPGVVASSGNIWVRSQGILRVVDVTTVSGLQAAVQAALPGDYIRFISSGSGIYSVSIGTGKAIQPSYGTYGGSGAGVFRPGNEFNPIIVEAVGPVCIDAGNATTTGGAFIDNNAMSYWEWRNFEIRNFKQGFVTTSQAYLSNHNTYKNLTIHNTYAEGLHIRHGYSMVVEDCRIYDTGLAAGAANGEGMYIGTHVGSWATYNRTGVSTDPAFVWDSVIRRCKIFRTYDDAIEIKENSYGNVIEECTFDSTGQRLNDQFVGEPVTLKGRNNTVRRNTFDRINYFGVHIYAGTSPAIAPSGNLIQGNLFNTASPSGNTAFTKYAIKVSGGTGNRVKTDNIITAGTVPLTDAATEA